MDGIHYLMDQLGQNLQQALAQRDEAIERAEQAEALLERMRQGPTGPAA